MLSATYVHSTNDHTHDLMIYDKTTGRQTHTYTCMHAFTSKSKTWKPNRKAKKEEIREKISTLGQRESLEKHRLLFMPIHTNGFWRKKRKKLNRLGEKYGRKKKRRENKMFRTQDTHGTCKMYDSFVLWFVLCENGMKKLFIWFACETPYSISLIHSRSLFFHFNQNISCPVFELWKRESRYKIIGKNPNQKYSVIHSH